MKFSIGKIFFVDIGYNSSVYSASTYVTFSTEQLISYIIEHQLKEIYLIHNHPENFLSPPSFSDYYTLSELIKNLNDNGINTCLTALVVSKKGIWKYNTSFKL